LPSAITRWFVTILLSMRGLVELVALDDLQRADVAEVGDQHVGQPLAQRIELGLAGVVVEVGDRDGARAGDRRGEQTEHERERGEAADHATTLPVRAAAFNATWSTPRPLTMGASGRPVAPSVR